MAPTIDTARTWQLITEARLQVADLLAGLTPEQWEHPSLCTHWRVRDVAGHLALVPHPPSAAALGRGLLRARGSFDRLNADMARRNARMPTRQIVAELREHAASRRVPVVTNADNVLFDVLVHTQDIAVPLDLDAPADVEAARAGAERVWAMGWPFHARRRLRGLRLVADDVAWSVGEGPEVTGPAQSLLLALTGRPAAVRRLAGPGAAELARRLGPDTPPR
jgi:uncharacterized protein (TIGR03083 family)